MKSLFAPFPTPLTGRQWFYLSVLQGVGAGIIDGGANFAVAYAMYHNQKDIKMWVLAKNTIAGDLGVTPIIQCLASMLITSTLVHTDLHHHAVAPLPFVWPHVEHLPDPREITDRFKRRSKTDQSDEKPSTSSPSPSPSPSDDQEVQVSKGALYYVKMLIRFIFEGTENNSLLSIPGSAPLPFRILLTAAQGAAIGIVFGLPLFLVFIIVLGPLYKHDNIAEVGWRWSPMVIKCVYGAVLGWITNPVIACLALGSQAEHHLLVMSDEALEEGQAEIEGPEGIETIHEEEEFHPPDAVSASVSVSGANPGHSSLRVPSIGGTPTKPPGRLRALSNLSTTSSSSRTRPPLTANCSNLPIVSDTFTSNSLRKGSMTSKSNSMLVPRTPKSAPLSSGESDHDVLAPPNAPALTPSLGSGSAATIGTGSGLTPERPGISPVSPAIGHGSRSQSQSQSTRGRTRGATISTFVSNVDSVGSGNHNYNYSYALGGTGGRAQRNKGRPRAISSLSNTARARKDDISNDSLATPAPAPLPSPLRINRIDNATSSISPLIQSSPRNGTQSQSQSMNQSEGEGLGFTTQAADKNDRPAVWDVFGQVKQSQSRKNLSMTHPPGRKDDPSDTR
ncbi:uncharacterized protein I303_103546 [Kwoniella dejecticola CBS 10117]|uniref:Uncharacterized protein n=1 Tax=Kwoniella dejecticola CBS 10117 TaxID=1296121 RepID=A0A1A6A721_9TREE|nr:uncharacterized protein I303_03568 [Kwoniella dejecticola CBS 10117]OBR85854.1 hypothetical protein I303_03568 [Kwoniella dejecticola CBS 10117]